MGDLKDQLGLPHRRQRRRRRTLADMVADVAGTSTVDSIDNILASPPPAEHHEMHPLSYHVTAPSVSSFSGGDPNDLRQRRSTQNCLP